MNRSVIFAIVILFAVVMSACKKHSVAPAPGSMLIPWNMDSLMPTSNLISNDRSQLNVSGILIYNQLSGNLTDTSGAATLYTRNWEAALFAGAPDNFIADVPAVSVNSTSLDTGKFLCFTHYSSADIWNEHDLNHWDVSGSGKIPAFSADVSGTMPIFTGTLPEDISISSDFIFTFNSSNTVNGDSAFVIIYGVSAASGAQFLRSNIVGTNAGTATISADRLASLQNGYTTLNGTVAAASLYYGGQIMVVIYNHTIQTIDGKQFAFVKQREYLGVVNFL